MRNDIPLHIFEQLHPNLQQSATAIYMPAPDLVTDEQIAMVMPGLAMAWKDVMQFVQLNTETHEEMEAEYVG